MKKLLFLLLLCCAAAALHAQTVEVSFNFVKQGGFGTNQFAVWIEDSNGNFIKTLYATKFTAQGGWKKRDQSIPQWVKQSGLAKMGKAQIDALTGSTPKSGALRYVWDGKNQNGTAVPAGEYKVFVEASLRGENRALYSTTVQIGSSPGQTEPAVQYFGSSTAERGMIGRVLVQYR
jgi:hypothetical protein